MQCGSAIDRASKLSPSVQQWRGASIGAAVQLCVECSGDDDGLIKTWDQRQAEPSGSFEAHTDFVSDMVLHEREQCLIAVSGDGTLTVNDLRTGKVRLCPFGILKGLLHRC